MNSMKKHRKVIFIGSLIFIISAIGIFFSESYKKDILELLSLQDTLTEDARFKYVVVQPKVRFERVFNVFDKVFVIGWMPIYKIAGVVKTEEEKEFIVKYVQKYLDKKVVDGVWVAGEQAWPRILKEAEALGLKRERDEVDHEKGKEANPIN